MGASRLPSHDPALLGAPREGSLSSACPQLWELLSHPGGGCLPWDQSRPRRARWPPQPSPTQYAGCPGSRHLRELGDSTLRTSSGGELCISQDGEWGKVTLVAGCYAIPWRGPAWRPNSFGRGETEGPFHGLEQFQMGWFLRAQRGRVLALGDRFQGSFLSVGLSPFPHLPGADRLWRTEQPGRLVCPDKRQVRA